MWNKLFIPRQWILANSETFDAFPAAIVALHRVRKKVSLTFASNFAKC